MQVPTAGSGEILRLLEALLPLPKLENVRAEPRVAPPPPVREDEVVLRYTAVSELMQSTGNPSVAVPPPAIVQNADAIVQQAALDPAIAIALAARTAQSGWAMPVAHPSIDVHGYVNYTNAAALTQAAVNGSIYVAAPVEIMRGGNDPLYFPSSHRRFAAFARAAQEGVRKLWVRAPLLVLLLSWLAAGLGAGVAMILFAASAAPVNFVFDAWGLGFLALAGFGFYMRVRNIRF